MMIDIVLGYLLLGSIGAVILFIWFNTNAFVEYMYLFDFEDKFYIDEYMTATKDDPGTSYPEYISTNHSSFFTRLFGCPKCLSVHISWIINAILFLILWLYMLPLWVTCLLFPISIIITIYFSLFLYYLLVKLMK